MSMAKQPIFNDNHLRRMCDDTGIYQHAKYDLPNPQEGYTTDDNARLMMMGAMYYEATGSAAALDLAYRGLGFLYYAEEGGWFRNFMGFDRRFLESHGSFDCFGRCLWCLGYIQSRQALPQGLRAAAAALLRKTAAGADTLAFLRSNAYAAMGLALWQGPEQEHTTLRKSLSFLVAAYEAHADSDWHWFEDEMTYCNAAMPHALLLGYEVLKEEKYRTIAFASLDFLLQHTLREGVFWPVGCHGWCPRGSHPADYDQQPVEACATLLACLRAHALSGDGRYLEAARACHGWFRGENSAGIDMVDPVSGGCYDGLRADGPNRNQGSESLLALYVSTLGLYLYERDEREGEKHAAGL